MGKTLHIYNPEHDLALAAGNSNYTPPAEILKLKLINALLPARYAGNGDFILVPKELTQPQIETSDFLPLAKSKNISVVWPKDIPAISHLINKVNPWGWDPAVKSLLESSGIEPSLLPSMEEIEKIRELSHRATSITFRKLISEILGIPEYLPAHIVHHTEEIPPLLERYHRIFFKAPWSSSGRGIVVSDHISSKGLMEWAHGTIKKQKCLIAEPAWRRKLDFATEWIIENQKARFIGYSVFETSSRGKYHGNMEASQSDILNTILREAPSFHSGYIYAQKNVIDSLISPFYSGPLGIDMLADTEGRINPCVEINLRHTMGLINILP